MPQPHSYRVVLIVPQGYTHASCFIELAILLKASLQDNGVDCDMTVNEPASNRINILLGYHLLANSTTRPNFDYIPYQLEQLWETGGAWSENIKALLENAIEVWDYSENNIRHLAAHNISARHLPIGYHRALEKIIPSPTRDIDILFYGSLGGRRTDVLQKIGSDNEIVSKLLFGTYGATRDAYISRSKIILNVHYYPTRIFEAVRVSFLLNNNCLVVTEHSSDSPYDKIDLIDVPYDQLIDTCKYYLANPQKARERSESNYRTFMAEYSMNNFIASIIH